MRYELVCFNTDSRYRDDVRYRAFTTSDRKAEQFRKIRRIQFSDSGHGLVFDARELHRGQSRGGPIHPYGSSIVEHVDAELKRIAREEKLPAEVRKLIDVARQLVSRAGSPSDDVLENPPREIPGDTYDRLHAAVEDLG